MTNALLSCTANDYGILAEINRNVIKTKVESKILCCAWSPSGQNFALGLYNGNIFIKMANGSEISTIRRAEPIWTLAFDNCSDLEEDILAVGCWDQVKREIISLDVVIIQYKWGFADKGERTTGNATVYQL